eukprot:1494915-Rhodomonas_salina.3
MCRAGETCVDTPSGYACECARGYSSAENGMCVNVNECASENVACTAPAVCIDTPGSFSCGCVAGAAEAATAGYDVHKLTVSEKDTALLPNTANATADRCEACRNSHQIVMTGVDSFFLVNDGLQPLSPNNYTLSFFHRVGTASAWYMYMLIVGENGVRFAFHFTGIEVLMRVRDERDSPTGYDDQALFRIPAQYHCSWAHLALTFTELGRFM